MVHEVVKGSVKTGIMGKGTGLIHIDKASCNGTCAGDASSVDPW